MPRAWYAVATAAVLVEFVMWCRHCQQEVPAIGAASAEGATCARCGRHEADVGEPPQPTPRTHDAARRRDSDSRRAIDRALRTARATVSAGGAATTLRFDLGQTGLAAADSTSPRRLPKPMSSSPPPPTRLGQWTAWAMALVGALVLGLGLGLLSWSALGGRYDLWNVSLAATFTGQGLLIVGLLQILANLWAAGRQAAWRLGQMHDELRRLRRANEEAVGRHSAGAANFYAGLANEAEPDVLVGNLQGQLDRLSARMRANG